MPHQQRLKPTGSGPLWLKLTSDHGNHVSNSVDGKANRLLFYIVLVLMGLEREGLMAT